MTRLRIPLALALAISLAACETNPYGGGYGQSGYGLGNMGGKELGGTLLGAAGGGLLGSQIGSGSGKLAAVAVGTLAGAWLGNSIGRSLDRADQQYAANAQYGALNSGYPRQWSNPQSGHYGTVNPGPVYSAGNGGQCRPYSHTVIIDGRQETMQGTACRNPNGTWSPA